MGILAAYKEVIRKQKAQCLLYYRYQTPFLSDKCLTYRNENE